MPFCQIPLLPRIPAFASLGVVAFAVMLLLAGCNLHASRAKGLELQNRWEEAAIEYHLASLEDPGVREYQESLVRANKAVARENFTLYKKYLARKQFKKAFQRLQDATRQDAVYAEAAAEFKKWLRVLVAGRVRFQFESLRANVALADEIRLMVRVNTPNPGEVIEAEINLDTGVFFVENLLYDRPSQMLAFYSLNSFGVSLVFSRGGGRSFSSKTFQRFIDFRSPVVDSIQGDLLPSASGGLEAVEKDGERARNSFAPITDWAPKTNPHYSLEIREGKILVTPKGGRPSFTPRFLYLNRQDQRLFVDFGGYEIKSHPENHQWGLTRLSSDEGDYFPTFSQNIALQPYFFYREIVYRFAPAGTR